MRRALVIALFPLLALAQNHIRSVGPKPPMSMGNAITGTVTSVNGNLVSLASGLVVLDATGAKIVARGNDSATVGAIAPGDLIVAVVKPGDVAANAPIPVSLIAVSQIADVTMTGAAQSANSQSFVVLGRTILVTPQTEFTGATSVAKGDLVLVEANVAGNALVAENVVVIPQSGSPIMPQFSMIRGTVKTIGTSSWTITDDATKNDVSLAVTNETRVEPGIAINDRVIVMARKDGNTLTAIAIMRNRM